MIIDANRISCDDTFSFYRVSIYTVMWNMISTFFILNYMMEDMQL